MSSLKPIADGQTRPYSTHNDDNAKILSRPWVGSIVGVSIFASIRTRLHHTHPGIGNLH